MPQHRYRDTRRYKSLSYKCIEHSTTLGPCGFITAEPPNITSARPELHFLCCRHEQTCYNRQKTPEEAAARCWEMTALRCLCSLLLLKVSAGEFIISLSSVCLCTDTPRSVHIGTTFNRRLSQQRVTARLLSSRYTLLLTGFLYNARNFLSKPKQIIENRCK